MNRIPQVGIPVQAGASRSKPLVPSNLVRIGLLRRQILVELKGADTIIQEAKRKDPSFNDPMTQQIEFWLKSFAADLKVSPNEEEVRDRFILLLQNILCDPLFQEPLDHTAKLGNDGRTYSQLSIDLHTLPLLREGVFFSPFDREKKERWAFKEHFVVQHMVKWLKIHGKVQEPKCLVEAFDQLQRQYPPEALNHIALKITQIMAEREKTMRCFEAKEEKDPEQHVSAKEEGADRRQLMRERLRAKLSKRADPFKEVKEQVDAQQVAEKADFEQLQGEVNQAREQLAPFEERVDAFAQQVMQDIQNIEQNDQQAQGQLQQLIQNLEVRIQELEARNQELEMHLSKLDQNIHSLEWESVQLHQRITTVTIKMLEEKKESKEGFLRTVVMVGISIFATPVISKLLEGIGIAAGMLPMPGGGKLFMSKPI